MSSRSDPALPDFDELPVLGGLNLRHAWGAFGPDDQLGTINQLTPERVRTAIGLVRSGEVVSLTLPITAFDPPFYGRDPIGHAVYRVDRNYWDDRLDSFLPQGSTHWDGLRHMQAREFGWWGGLTDEAAMHPGPGSLGIEHWARHAIVGRGVLLDLEAELSAKDPGYDAHVTRSVGVDVLEAAASRQGIETEPGDILCIRFGWLARYRGLDPAGRREAATADAFAGLAADEGMARWLWNRRLSAVAADNPAIEVSPGKREVGSLHRRLLPLLGFALGELFDFDELARRCAVEGRWSFLFASVPLHILGGVGSPANAIAIL
jgi:kynurenine formamidase